MDEITQQAVIQAAWDDLERPNWSSDWGPYGCDSDDERD